MWIVDFVVNVGTCFLIRTYGAPNNAVRLVPVVGLSQYPGCPLEGVGSYRSVGPQLAGVMWRSYKSILQGQLLTDSHSKTDAVTLLVYMAPLSALTKGCVLALIRRRYKSKLLRYCFLNLVYSPL